MKFLVGNFYTYRDDFTTIYECIEENEFISLQDQKVGEKSWKFKFDNIKSKLIESTDQDIIDDISELLKIELINEYSRKSLEESNKKLDEFRKVI